MIWEILFVCSALINVVFILYARWLLRAYDSLLKDTYAINESILQFSSHLKAVNELEMFYGDETIQKLMAHAKEISNMIEELDLLIEDDKDSKKETQEDKE